MSEKDLEKFIHKVNQLNEMIESLETMPSRRKELSNCSSHQQVIELAKSWGFEIDKRWGEGNPTKKKPRTDARLKDFRNNSNRSN
tara:strand:+ start:1017 stop:1271 length:255 start_codon:yes stop_codon:yes gene_type:complete